MIDPRMAILSERTQAAGTRAIESTKRLRRFAERLSEEMDEVTAPHGIQVTGFSEEDSLVTSIEAVMASAAASHKR